MAEYKDRLQQAMTLRSVEKQELANAIGISYQAVRKVLLGLSGAFTAANNAKAASFLHVNPDWLAADIGSMELPSDAASAEERAVVESTQTWPFSPDLLDQVLALDDRERLQLEGALRLALAQIRPVDGQKKTANGSVISQSRKLRNSNLRKVK